MKYFATLGAVCAIGLSALAGQAQAEIYHLNTTGKIDSGVDTRGLFGTSGADLSGHAYSVTFTFDPGLLDFVDVNEALYQSRLYIGDIGIAEVTIDGVSYAYNADGIGQFTFLKFAIDPSVTTGGISNSFGATLGGAGGYLSMGLFSATHFSDSVELTALFDYTLSDADHAIPLSDANYWDGGDFKFTFRPDTVSLTSEPGTLAGVPEPTSWALMITGFGLAGVAVRARRRATASV